MKRVRVVVTGLGVVSSIGIGWRAFWEALLAGRSGIKRIQYLDASKYPTQYGGEVGDFDPLQFIPPRAAIRMGRGTQFAVAATKMALEDAQLFAEELEETRVGVCLGTTMADIQALEAANQTWVQSGEGAIPSSLV